ncbi:ABC transporter permease [Pseudomonas abietaniphila]
MKLQHILIAAALTPLLVTIGYPLGALLISAISVEEETGLALSLAPLTEVFTAGNYISVLFNTLGLCALTAILSILIALPTAIFVWTRTPSFQLITLVLVVLPMFMSYIVKVYTMRSLLGLNGLVNQLLLGMEVIQQPTPLLLFNRGAILATFVVLYIPFAALPIYLSLERIPANVVVAARDLGATPLKALKDIVIPLAMPGVIAAGLFTFILALGDFITPEMVGGPSGMTFGRIVWSQFGLAFNYPLGSALGVVLLIVTVIALGSAAALTHRAMRRGEPQ